VGHLTLCWLSVVPINDPRIYKNIYLRIVFFCIFECDQIERGERIEDAIKGRHPTLSILINSHVIPLSLSLSPLSLLSGHTDSYIQIVYMPVISTYDNTIYHFDILVVGNLTST
jgi:hypothetical protein